MTPWVPSNTGSSSACERDRICCPHTMRLTPTMIYKCIYASAAALCITEWSSNRTYKRVGILYYEERGEVKMIHLSPAMHFAGWYICFCLRLLEMRIFCVGDASTVYEANRGMPLPFCISLLDSVLICMYRRKRAVLSAVRADLVQLHSILVPSTVIIFFFLLLSGKK